MHINIEVGHGQPQEVFNRACEAVKRMPALVSYTAEVKRCTEYVARIKIDIQDPPDDLTARVLYLHIEACLYAPRIDIQTKD